MTYQELDSLLGLTNLNICVSQLTLNSCQVTAVMQPGGSYLSLEEDKWKYWGLNFDWNIWGTITDALKTVQKNIQDVWLKIIAMWDFIWAAIGTGWKTWWNEIWEAIRRQYYNFSAAFFEFTRDPWGYLYRVIQGTVRPLIDGIKAVGIDIWDFTQKVYSRIYEWLEPRLTTMNNFLWGKISELWISVKTITGNLVHEIVDPIGNTFSWLWDRMKDFFEKYIATPFHKAFLRMAIAWEDIKLPFTQIGIYISEFFGTIKTLITNPKEFFRKLLLEIGIITSSDWFRGIWDSVKGAWGWLVSIFRELWEGIKYALYKMAPTSPEQGEALIASALQLLGLGVGALGAFTGVSMAVSWLSKHHLGHLSAILYDISSYKYITGAVMGGLVAAAYAQPLKYYYNALFKPWLPSWMDAQMALGRSKISVSLFKFFQKYAGIDEKYFPIYSALAKRPISAFMIRYIADAEITDPAGIFEVCMDNGYSVEHSIYMAFAMSYGANGMYRKTVEFALTKCFKEGFISVERMSSEIDKARAATEVPASYTTTDGYTYRATIKAPLDQKTLMAMANEWESFYDSMLDKVSTLKTLYGKETIIESELRSGLIALGIVPNRLEDIVSREKAKKKGKDEPDKGKDLRKELKSVVTRCYKEGLITHAKLKSFLSEANETVDESELIPYRANWEAFYDDMMDWRKIYVSSLADGLITEAEFRRDLIGMGFRSQKVELLIEYDKAKKLGKAAKK